MKPIYVKESTQEERSKLQKELHSSSGFTVRRCQILLSSAAGKTARQIGAELHCSDQSVRNAIRAFEQEGLSCLQEKSHARHNRQSAFDEAGRRSRQAPRRPAHEFVGAFADVVLAGLRLCTRAVDLLERGTSDGFPGSD